MFFRGFVALTLFIALTLTAWIYAKRVAFAPSGCLPSELNDCNIGLSALSAKAADGNGHVNAQAGQEAPKNVAREIALPDLRSNLPEVVPAKKISSQMQQVNPDVSLNHSFGESDSSVNGYVNIQTGQETPKDAAREIVLPDLGGDLQEIVPVKKSSSQMQQVNPDGSLNHSSGQSASTASLIPLIPYVNIGDAGAGATIGATSANAKFESKDYMANIGLNYLSPGSTYGLGVKADGAILLGKTTAIGTNLSINNSLKEAVLNGVWMPAGANLKAKLSGAYMWGAQNFEFFSGNSEANIGQASFYFSTQYIVPKEQSDYLHSIGISTWGSQARQTNNPATIYSVAQTPSAYQIMSDPQKLAVGTLQGESLDAQVGMTKQVIVKASAGYETLKFPFSDGTQELNIRMYQDYLIQYQPIEEVSLQAGYKIGAAMNNIMLSAAYAQLKITGYKNNGVNGVIGNQGVMLTYSFPLDGVVKSTPFGTLSRPELIGGSGYILRDANTRPVQLPQAFLAKVDTTAVKTVATINKASLPNGATVNSAGDVVLLVGSGGGSITGVTRNGANYSNAATAQIIGNNLVIHTGQFPAAGNGGDTYVYSVTDSGGTPYLVTINTQN